ncbi:phage baseplate assembly protein V [Flammeovirga pacifica]|uniref:Gp5/Type VI secretion system Vgr protein OB-fold domain-containing protein n=1 Tax=Flammeovirga pacifica TaxID=915059 RepID=A0A1S1YVB6_FLAPC|nr:phage baseplate assembly protein V [Flammeovirga pacifica]OHX64966.1 hypothetical protein NH26_00685 [Flammeovirga pacifica]
MGLNQDIQVIIKVDNSKIDEDAFYIKKCIINQEVNIGMKAVLFLLLTSDERLAIKVGSTLSIELKSNSNRTVFKGFVLKYGYSRELNQRYMNIQAGDIFDLMKQSCSNQLYEGVHSKVADILLQKWKVDYQGNIKETSSKGEEEVILQYQKNDYDFLLEQLKMTGSIISINSNAEFKIVHYEELSDNINLALNEAIAYDIQYNGLGTTSLSSIAFFNTEDQLLNVEESKSINPKSNGLEEEEQWADLSKKDEGYYSNYQKLSVDDLKEKYTFDVALQNMTQCRGYICSDQFPDVEIGEWLTLEDDGISDTVFITSIEYQLEEEEKKVIINFGESLFIDDSKKEDSSSLHLGIVQQVQDTGDIHSNDKYLIQVELPYFTNNPFVDKTTQFIWAKLMSSSAGSGHGFLWVPKVGDQVVVSFLGDTFDHPIVLGSIYKTTDEHPQVNEQQNKGFFTSNALKFFMNDETKHIEMSTENYGIKMNEEEESLSIFMGEDIQLIAQANGELLIKSSSKITFESPEILMKSENKLTLDTEELSLNGKQKIEVNSDGDFVASATKALSIDANNSQLKLNATQILMNS